MTADFFVFGRFYEKPKNGMNQTFDGYFKFAAQTNNTCLKKQFKSIYYSNIMMLMIIGIS